MQPTHRTALGVKATARTLAVSMRYAEASSHCPAAGDVVVTADGEYFDADAYAEERERAEVG